MLSKEEVKRQHEFRAKAFKQIWQQTWRNSCSSERFSAQSSWNNQNNCFHSKNSVFMKSPSAWFIRSYFKTKTSSSCCPFHQQHYPTLCCGSKSRFFILVAIYLWLFMHVAFRHQLKSIFESKASEQLTSISDAPIQSLFLLLRNSNSSFLSVLVITILKFQSLSTVKSNFRFWLHDI